MPVHLIDFYGGWEKHNSLLVRALSPLGDEELSWSAAPNLWPIRTLANHIVAARAWWFGSWMGEGGDTLARLLDYDEDGGSSARDAPTICEALDASWVTLAECLSRWTEADLQQTFQRPRASPHHRPSRNRDWIIWHVAEHDLHHGGEISLTLGMHGGTGLDL
jgi:uncharacterized damage-inducible protein DinB